MKFWHKYRIYCIFLISGFVAACANVMELSGGIKDVDPPIITKSLPENETTNFSSKEIQLSFSEFVKLNNVSQHLLVSPPFDEKPVFKIRGKNIFIQLKDSLKTNTTYSLFFGDAIVDITEANPLSGYSYVFSTGNKIDSLRVKGQIKDAFTLEPSADVFVMLYKNHSDTTPMRALPDYIAKTRKDGVFSLNNLAAGNYKIFALSDANNNYKFDLPTEAIAFLDSLVIPEIVTEIKIDTIYKPKPDTTLTELIIDTIINRERNTFIPNNLVLNIFTEDHKKQYISKKLRTERHKAEIVFNRPIYDTINFWALDGSIDENQYIIEKSKLSDSLIFWLTDSALIEKDSIGFIFQYLQLDSLENASYEQDTIFLVYKDRIEKKKKDEIIIKETIKVQLKLQQGVQHFNKPLIMGISSPVKEIDISKIRLFVQQDTVKTLCNFKLEKDSENSRLFIIENNWIDNARYFLYIDSLAFVDYYGIVCDSTEFSFNTRCPEDYGILVFNITGVNSPVIIQMLDKSKKKILKEIYLAKNKRIKFMHIPAQELSFRAIIDENGNKRYDTGLFILHRQPEEVKYFSKPVVIKNNWEIEEDWNLSE